MHRGLRGKEAVGGGDAEVSMKKSGAREVTWQGVEGPGAKVLGQVQSSCSK